MSVTTPAVLYAAKSTEDRQGSIATQLADCRAMADREGWRVVDEQRDEGFSAYRGTRGPGLERAKRRAVQEAASGESCVLVVQHSDRLARGMGDAPGAADHLGELHFWARRHNVRLRSVQDDSNFDDAIRAVLIGERNAEDSKRKSEATRAGKRRRFERGESTGPTPFGYRLVDATDDEGRPITIGDRIVRKRAPHPDEGPVVIRMFEMLDAGYSIGHITRWANEQGLCTKRGKPFGRNRIREILTNPVYGGKVRQHGELRDGSHQPLISWEEFVRISSKLSREDRRRGGRPSQVALLSNLLRCADCGGGIWHRKSGKRRRYQCGWGRHATGACSATSFDAVQVEKAVLDHLTTLFVDFEGWLAEVTEQRRAQREGLVRQLAAADEQRAGLARDEELVRADYRLQLRAGNERAADFVTDELDRIASERAEIDDAVKAFNARLAEWDSEQPADAMLDWWNELSSAIRGEVVGADSVRDANTALRERFAAIFTEVRGDSVRLDFVLREREADDPLVSTRVWATPSYVSDGDRLVVDMIADGPPPKFIRTVETGRLTLV